MVLVSATLIASVVTTQSQFKTMRAAEFDRTLMPLMAARAADILDDHGMGALADFLTNDYDNSATFVVLAHLSEQNNHPEIARREAERALAERGGLFQNRVLVAVQSEVLPPIQI